MSFYSFIFIYLYFTCMGIYVCGHLCVHHWGHVETRGQPQVPLTDLHLVWNWVSLMFSHCLNQSRQNCTPQIFSFLPPIFMEEHWDCRCLYRSTYECSLKKTDLSSPRDCQLPILSLIRVGLHVPFPSLCWDFVCI